MSERTSEAGRTARAGRTSHLVREWIVCAIAFAAARFIPVPLLDDAVRERAARIAVVRTLRAHGRTYPSSAVEPLYDLDLSGTHPGLRRRLGRAVRKVVLFPVRKYVALFGAVKGVPTDVMTLLLLSRALSRALAEGRLRGGDEEALRAESLAVRRAFEEAVDGMDLRMLSGALAEGLSQARGLTSAAVDYARRSFAREDEQPALDPGGEVGAAAGRVEGVLRRREIAELLERLDARFDARLAATAPSPRP